MMLHTSNAQTHTNKNTAKTQANETQQTANTKQSEQKRRTPNTFTKHAAHKNIQKTSTNGTKTQTTNKHNTSHRH